jgi:hypothetical protein
VTGLLDGGINGVRCGMKSGIVLNAANNQQIKTKIMALLSQVIRDEFTQTAFFTLPI